MDTISNFLCVEKMGWSDAYEQGADSFSAYVFTEYYGAAVCGLTVTSVMDFKYAK